MNVYVVSRTLYRIFTKIATFHDPIGAWQSLAAGRVQLSPSNQGRARCRLRFKVWGADGLGRRDFLTLAVVEVQTSIA